MKCEQCGERKATYKCPQCGEEICKICADLLFTCEDCAPMYVKIEDNNKAFEKWWSQLILSGNYYTPDFREVAQKSFLAACKMKDKVIKKVLEICPSIIKDECGTCNEEHEGDCDKCILDWAENEVKKDLDKT